MDEIVDSDMNIVSFAKDEIINHPDSSYEVGRFGTGYFSRTVIDSKTGNKYELFFSPHYLSITKTSNGIEEHYDSDLNGLNRFDRNNLDTGVREVEIYGNDPEFGNDPGFEDAEESYKKVMEEILYNRDLVSASS